MKKQINKVIELKNPTVSEIKHTTAILSKIEKCTLTFTNEDMNKLVEKLNEVIEKYD